MNPVYVAADTPDLSRAQRIAEAVTGHVGGLKLGLEFFCSAGPPGIEALRASRLPIFLDLKLHDIPNTVGKAMAALAPLAPAIVTVHAAGGRAMLRAAKENAPPGCKVVAVTVLTSLDEHDLQSTGVGGGASDQVARLADLGQSAGLDGIVCSGAEVAGVRARWPEGYLVVPGIRPAGGDAGDQKRVVTPAQALADGASVLVVGRPITGAPDIANAARAIAAQL